MKPTSARFLTRLPFAIAMALPALLAVLAAREARAAATYAATVCRTSMATVSRSYLEQVLGARNRCQARLILRAIPLGTNCLTGRGDEQLDLKLRRAEDKLSNFGAACEGVNLQLLGFPGVCADTTGGKFDTEDFKKCVLTKTNQIVTNLLDHYYPPLTAQTRGNPAKCMIGAGIDATSSYRNMLRARERCMIDQETGTVPLSVGCREDILPYGPGTGSATVDSSIGNSYVRLLGAIPKACVTTQIDDLDYQSSCPDTTGGAFTIFDLKNCFFNQNREQTYTAMAVPFPTDPVCGDGVKAVSEECDDGITNNSNTRPNACRTDCTLPKCHDGVTDNAYNEQCDDGNTVDYDCCSGNCVLDVCGDGTINCGEQCDNGADNANTADKCRATGPNACKNPICGDHIVDSDEQCDDGNKIDEDGCNAFCEDEFCGDGIVQAKLGEECDDGPDNSNSIPDACRTTCKSPRCGDAVTDPSNGEDCDDGNTNNLDGCANNCTVCGDNIRKGDEECDGTDIGICAPGEGCNSKCTCEAACPSVGELTLYAGAGEVCDTNADCPAGSCQDGRCRTVTRLDSGWAGGAHASDINDGIRTRGFIDCPGHGPTCGQCNLVGVDPSTRSCRCANSTRTVCDQPFQADANDCNGAICDCYFGAPFPLASGGTPACVVNRFSENISGTANVDQGSGFITAKLKTRVYLGIAVANPCPTCGGKCSNDSTIVCNRNDDCDGGTCNLDPVAEDGIRGGVCIGGDFDGESCDAGGRNTSLPAFPEAPNGADYSLDCLPANGINISGTGLSINLSQTSGSTSLSANVSCGGQSPELFCPCLMCSGDTSVSCNKNSDCAGQSGSCTIVSGPAVTCLSNTDCARADVGPCRLIGTLKCDKLRTQSCLSNTDCLGKNMGPCLSSSCSSDAKAGYPSPNQCDDGECVDTGGGKGECHTGPDDTFCDGVVKADGGGVYSCNGDLACKPSSIGVDAGNCTLVVRRPCFLDPIVSSGQADPTSPVGAATFCIPPTTNNGINLVAGLPGPGRIVNQTKSKTFCENNTAIQYVPGVGGCIKD